VITFDPHPAAVLRPQRCPSWIIPIERRLELIEQAGVATALVVGSDPAFFERSADEFLRAVVLGRFAAQVIVEGPDFHFGKDRGGTVESLRRSGPAMGLEVIVVEPVPAPPAAGSPGRNVASTLVRELIAFGKVEQAAACLGRPFELQGVVEHGAARGRALGFPTANLRPAGQMLPAPGVYAGRLAILRGAGGRPPPAGGSTPAAVFVGSPPTFPGEPARVEAFLPDFSGDLYGVAVRIALTRRLRDLIAFTGPDELSRQVADDVRRVRAETVTEKAEG
jgi:riboflavin kinase/FMN adenylyltransferase